MNTGSLITNAPQEIEGPATEISLASCLPSPELEISISGLDVTGSGECGFGTWEFHRVPPGPSTIRINWSGTGTDCLELIASDGTMIEPTLSEKAPGAMVWPSMQVVVRSGAGEEEARLKVSDTGLLKDYYQREDHQQQYVVEHPFFNAFHRGRLQCLERLFNTYIPLGSNVLDVGSGYGVFYMISEDWDLDITCCDLDVAAMEKMRGLAPQWNWVVADALDLPWDDSSYNALYAGEIIEHVSRPDEAMAEWNRVLAPGGVLVLSTPNRDRLLARAKKEDVPVHHEHQREMNLEEMRSMARRGGFDVLKVTGVYLEFLINWWRPPSGRVDLLTARLGKPRYDLLYRAAMEFGRLAPALSFDLFMVCRKKSAAGDLP